MQWQLLNIMQVLLDSNWPVVLRLLMIYTICQHNAVSQAAGL